MAKRTTPDKLVLVAGDWHGNGTWAATCCKLAKRYHCSRLLQLGDFGIWDRNGTKRYLNGLETAAVSAGVTVYAIGGNHENYDIVDEIESGAADDDGFFAIRPHVRWIPRGHRWNWEGVRFGALGGAFSLDYKVRMPGMSWWPLREEVRPADLERLGTGPLDVLVTHDIPFGAEPYPQMPLPADIYRQAQESRVLLFAAVEATRPSLVLHGHWHRRNSRVIDLPGNPVRVEGLESDQEAGPRSWGVLDFGSLGFEDGCRMGGT